MLRYLFRADVHVRKQAQPLALFLAALPCNASGVATVRFKLPDNIGTWAVRVVAVGAMSKDRSTPSLPQRRASAASSSHQLLYGTAVTQFVARKKINLLPAMPRVARTGDIFTGGCTVTTLLATEVDVWANVVNTPHLALSGPAHVRVGWLVVAMTYDCIARRVCLCSFRCAQYMAAEVVSAFIYITINSQPLCAYLSPLHCVTFISRRLKHICVHPNSGERKCICTHVHPLLKSNTTLVLVLIQSHPLCSIDPMCKRIHSDKKTSVHICACDGTHITSWLCWLR